jgi:hypothetical protein
VLACCVSCSHRPFAEAALTAIAVSETW